MSFVEADSVSDLVHKLVVSILGDQNPDAIRRYLRFSLRLLSSNQSVDIVQEETAVVNHIKTKFTLLQEAQQFDKLHSELKDGPFKNRTSILTFLYYVKQTGREIREKNFLFPDMRLSSNYPSASTSGTSLQTSYSAGQVVPVLSESNFRGLAGPTGTFSEDCVSESVLVHDLIYSFQGIEGKVLKLDCSFGFQLDPSVSVTGSHRQVVLRLSELGFLYNTIKRGLERISAGSSGRVADSFVSALRQELSEYYRFIALLEEDVTRSQNPLSMETVTLSHLNLWSYEPRETLKWLAEIVNACRGKRGGALASAVYEFSYQGDAGVQKLVKRIMQSVCNPLYSMLMQWITVGQLDDPYREFFIESCSNVVGDRMWHEKYQVRDSMVPCFISKAQAKKILGTGKSINFLREVCKYSEPLKGKDKDVNAQNKYDVEAFFDMDPDGRLQTMMDTAYEETSTRVVEVLNKQYHLMDHLQGIKGYLLLGQGHFIQHLMHLLQPELDKPATSLYPHNISSILESAIRATSSKLEEVDVQRRLDVRYLQPSENETGWDVFVLDYNVDGPIGTILEPCRQTYQTVFFSLWKAKRMETILSAIWKQQTTSAKMFRKMPEVMVVHNQIHLITSSMVHLVHQMQYYFIFEVIECSWDSFVKELNQAKSLDEIIATHNKFIESVKTGTLLDEDSQELKDHLRSVYVPIMELQTLEETFLAKATHEYEARLNDEQNVEKTNERVWKWGRTKNTDTVQNERQVSFKKYLSTLSRQLKLLSNSYQDRVKKFLLMLALTDDLSLRLLSVRLDFNEYYKSKDSRLLEPLTYMHTKQSDHLFSGCK